MREVEVLLYAPLILSPRWTTFTHHIGGCLDPRVSMDFLRRGRIKSLVFAWNRTTILQSCSSSVHLWRCSPFWALACLITRLHSSLSSARLLYFLIPRICDLSLWSTSSHLLFGFPTGLLLWNFPLWTFFFEILTSFILHPAHSLGFIQ